MLHLRYVFSEFVYKKKSFLLRRVRGAKSLAAPEIGAMPQIRDKGKSVLNMSYYLTKNTKVCLTKIQLEYPLSYFLPRNAPNSVINCPDFAFS